jgi:hypothetical protein
VSGDTHELLALGSRNRLIPPQLLGVAAAKEVKRIVEMPLPADGFVVVVAFRGGQPLEAFGDRFQAGGLRREIGPSGVRAAHDGRQPVDGLVFDLVCLDDGVERALLAVVAEFRARRVVGDRAGLGGNALDLFDRDEQKLGFLVDKGADESWARNSVDLHIGAGDPFHGGLLEVTSAVPGRG